MDTKNQKYVVILILVIAMPLLYIFSTSRAKVVIDIKDMVMDVNLVEFSNCSYVQTERFCNVVMQDEQGVKYNTKIVLDNKMQAVKLSDKIKVDFKRITTKNMYEHYCLTKLSINDISLFYVVEPIKEKVNKVDDFFKDCHFILK